MQKAAKESLEAKKQLEYYKALADAYEKRNWKLDILNDNLYYWAYGLGMAFFISLVFNIIQFFTS